MTASAIAAIQPTFSVNKELVCEVYLNAYNQQLIAGLEPSFATIEVKAHENGTVYTPDIEHSIPVTFSQPIEHSDVNWMQWALIQGMDHSFKWGGTATNITAIGQLKPTSDTSFVLQVRTSGWRGPYFTVLLIKDTELQALIDSADKSSGIVPFRESRALKIYPNQEQNVRYGVTNLFEFGGQFYSVTDDTVLNITSGKPKVVCKLGLISTFSSSQLSALAAAANVSLMTKGVTHIRSYYGSMGNPHRLVKDGFKTAIEKPWLVRISKQGECYVGEYIDSCDKNRRIEAVLDQFAATDPWSHREIQAIRHHMDGAHLILTRYYTDQLNIESTAAQGMATQAIYDFLARTVFLHPYIRHGVENSEPAENPYTLDLIDGSIETNWFGKTQLMWAAHFNDYDALNRILDTGTDLTSTTHSNNDYASVQFLNRSALTYAAENSTVPVIQALLSAGLDPNMKDSEGNGIEHYFKKNLTLDMTWAALKDATNAPIKASFDCQQARTNQELAICASQGLSVYDQQLGLLYHKVRATQHFPEIKTLQRAWLKTLQTECSSSESELINCMKVKYRSRIKYLQNLLSSLE